MIDLNIKQFNRTGGEDTPINWVSYNRFMPHVGEFVKTLAATDGLSDIINKYFSECDPFLNIFSEFDPFLKCYLQLYSKKNSFFFK